MDELVESLAGNIDLSGEAVTGIDSWLVKASTSDIGMESALNLARTLVSVLYNVVAHGDVAKKLNVTCSADSSRAEITMTNSRRSATVDARWRWICELAEARITAFGNHLRGKDAAAHYARRLPGGRLDITDDSTSSYYSAKVTWRLS